MKKFLHWAVYISLASILLVYIVLAGFLWASERWIQETQNGAPPLIAQSNEKHQITLLDEGLESLSQRILLIQKAQQSIELEFFIYELDFASEVITQALIQAAQKGVKVKLLVDFSAPVFKLKPKYAALLKRHGIEVKYYNTVGLIRFVSVQHRSHRKLLIIDDRFCITGGRNIGNDYFDLSEHYNFLDSDILIEGAIVKKIRESFDNYWFSPIANTPDPSEDDQKNSESLSFGSKTESLSKFYHQLDIFRKDKAHRRTSSCDDLFFVSDSPGLFLSNRQVYPYLEKFLAGAEEHVLGESPYFVLRRDGIELLKGLSKRGIKQTFLTNSLYSTDAFYTISGMFSSLKQLAEADITLYAYDGSRPKNHSASESELLGSANRWGIHSKRAVVDKKHVLIGTYNVDPRSANLNSELLVLCRNNPVLAAQVTQSINSRLDSSHPLVSERLVNLSNLFGKAHLKDKLLFILALPLAQLFNFLL